MLRKIIDSLWSAMLMQIINRRTEHRFTVAKATGDSPWLGVFRYTDRHIDTFSHEAYRLVIDLHLDTQLRIPRQKSGQNRR